MTHSIIVKLEKADAYLGKVSRKKARDFRLSAAVELLAIQKQVQEEGLIAWREWCKQNLPEISPQKIASVLRLVRSDAPRPQKPPPAPPPDTPIMAETKKLFRQLSFDQRDLFLRWVKETGLY